MEWDELHETGKTWRVRARLLDRPGALARLTTRLSEQGCNLLGVSVLPVAGESMSLAEAGHVVDEFVLRAPAELRQGELITMIEAQGAKFVGMRAASVNDLVDSETAVLRAARSVLSGRVTVADAVRLVLGADSVRYALAGHAGEPHPRTIELQRGAHVAVLDGGANGRLVASRGWAPFTEGELTRVPALFDLLETTDRRLDLPRAVATASGVGIVLRPARADDVERLTDMHRKCSAATLFARYHAGMRRLPRGWAERLLSPPRGRTLLAAAGGESVGFAQLIPDRESPDKAELSLLVQDEWQRQGVGTALLLALHDMARAEGIGEMTALCVAGSTSVLTVAARAGLRTSARLEAGMTCVSIPVEPLSPASPFPDQPAAPVTHRDTPASGLSTPMPPAPTPPAPIPPAQVLPPPDETLAPEPPRQLSALDVQFLNAETPTNPIHIGTLAVLDTAASEPLSVSRLRDTLEGRLHLLPALRRRLQTVPLGLDLPYWIDSATDLEYHVRESALPGPGTDEQLGRHVAELAQDPLDRSRPLWECHLISGLAGGRQAIYMKIHHCVIDGVSGTEVMAALFDLETDAAPATDANTADLLPASDLSAESTIPIRQASR